MEITGVSGSVLDGNQHPHRLLHPAGQVELHHVRGVETHPVVIPRTAVYVVQRGGAGEVVDLGPGAVARVTARYPSPPWFVRSATIDRIVGRLAADGLSIEIQSSALAVTA